MKKKFFASISRLASVCYSVILSSATVGCQEVLSNDLWSSPNKENATADSDQSVTQIVDKKLVWRWRQTFCERRKHFVNFIQQQLLSAISVENLRDRSRLRKGKLGAWEGKHIWSTSKNKKGLMHNMEKILPEERWYFLLYKRTAARIQSELYYRQREKGWLQKH